MFHLVKKKKNVLIIFAVFTERRNLSLSRFSSKLMAPCDFMPYFIHLYNTKSTKNISWFEFELTLLIVKSLEC